MRLTRLRVRQPQSAARLYHPVTVQSYLDTWQQPSGVPRVAVGIVLKDGSVIAPYFAEFHGQRLTTATRTMK